MENVININILIWNGKKMSVYIGKRSISEYFTQKSKFFFTST